MTPPFRESPTLLLPPTPAGIARAAELLRAGELVAFPTETVYGLGADATSGEAVARIYAAKERPRFNPLIAHYPDRDSAARDGRFDDAAERLARAFWPGPLTLVVPKSAGCAISDLAGAGLDSVALRVPSHPLARALLAETGRPVAAPSANRSGRVSPTCAAHVLADLDGRIAAVLDGGTTDVGVESTIVSCVGARPALLRPGGVTRETIAAVLGFAIDEPRSADTAAPVAPGQLASHYAPRARVRLNANAIAPGEAALLFGAPLPGTEQAAAHVNLSESGDLGQAAARLFASLRALDRPGIACIAVAPVPGVGLGEAINDRLKRAAAPRPQGTPEQ
ncbi:MAG: L-threonylcarbamoyladenylate synthase [Pseudochelatococcus sp.]|jgi:L-threonylcarbamoyladenylate synthase|uniref:L-threonylcarbamoyladenylate synthase n=1 Tax=Pseudochelatococcus sp. TaxID=2020869 RepID=UPI003D9225D3